MVIKSRGVVTLISGEMDFKSKKVTGDKEGHYILTKDQYSKNIIINIYTSNNMTSKYIKQKLTELKGETILQ